MFTIADQLAQDLSLSLSQVQAVLELLNDGATIPFIARYRKERTGEMTEVQLREFVDRYTYLTDLNERKATILKSIEQQGRLTSDLKAQIEACLLKNELEDLYLPYRPKRRTRAAIARERGLEPLAHLIQALNCPHHKGGSLQQEASPYINSDQDLPTLDAVLKGASDILAETLAERAEVRVYVRKQISRTGIITAKIKPEHPVGSTKFEMYRDYSCPIGSIAPHNLLALLRGDTEKILSVQLTFDEALILSELERREIKTQNPDIRVFLQTMIKDALTRLLKGSLVNEVMTDRKVWADQESIKTFAANLRDLLLAAPAGMQPTLGIDPGFRTGCKVAVLSKTGQLIAHQTLYPHQGSQQRDQAIQTVQHLIQTHQIQLIAIGNGTAGRETDQFIGECLQGLDSKPIKVMVSEAGASVYSASPLAVAEFPDLDVTVRGAISIGRRLQDPLAELVKIDPKSIGVGQYQHDVDQKQLKQTLQDTVESCVNYVGVDVNTASKELLTYVAGITPRIAANLVQYRDQQGPFQNRRTLLKVPQLGPKAFEQAAGFLRIRQGDHPLDNTAVHPERYPVVEQMATDLKVALVELPQATERLKHLDLAPYINSTLGEPTLRDILQELEKPGRDPRDQFLYATFSDHIQTLEDLQVGMDLEGMITNVTNFGAFVDIGVHQDGLVHISQLANQFVSDPKAIVKVGQIVKVRVLQVDPKLKRISLSMKVFS